MSYQSVRFRTAVVQVGVRDSFFVVVGLLWQEFDLLLVERYIVTAGFAVLVFGLVVLFVFLFARGIRVLVDALLFMSPVAALFGVLQLVLSCYFLHIARIRVYCDYVLLFVILVDLFAVTSWFLLCRLVRSLLRSGLGVVFGEVVRIVLAVLLLVFLRSVGLRCRF
ncbi:Tn3 family transposase [Enterobacter asburiae]|uniref:Tn3 family transposase n=1 Tax=Enterobacter asburiae TaxID=61645 RepID=UPI00299F9034|nr:hypothetical protein [Enterobacter asburiae]